MNGASDSLNAVAMPQLIFQNYTDMVDYPFGIKNLKKGRLPYDYANEIAISENLLKQYYNYNDEMIRTAIGKKIVYNKKEYTIVGIHYVDVAVLSYEKNINLGFYEYDKRSFDKFAEKNKICKRKRSHIYPTTTDEMVIITRENKEKEVLNRLFKNYPAENYDSRHYALVWTKQFNLIFLKKLIIFNLIFSAIFGIILVFIYNQKYYLDTFKIRDYENYYLDKRKIKTIYCIWQIGKYIFITAGMLIINGIYSKFSFSSNYILLFDAFTIFSPVTISCLWRTRQ